MNLTEATRVVRRRWYVIVPLLLLTLIATFGIDRAEKTKYEATSTFSLLASQKTVQGSSAAPGTENPYLSFDASLNDMADFLTRRVDAPDSAQQLAKLGVTEAYSAELAANAEGPFITLTVIGTDPAHVSKSIDTLLSFSEQELSTIQTDASVAQSAMIGSMVIVSAGPPTTQLKSKIQAVIGVLVVGLVFSFLATFASDSFLAARSRRQRNLRRTNPGQSASSPPPPRYSRASDESEPSGPAERSAPPDRTEVLTGLPETRD
jgi:uncharacterized protein involved in exopolysaccharide biosynthesis